MSTGAVIRVLRSPTAWRVACVILAVAVVSLAVLAIRTSRELDRQAVELDMRIGALEVRAESASQAGELSRRVELLELRAHALNGVRHDEERMRLVMEIRERIHRSVPVGSPPSGFDFDLPAAAWRGSVVSGDAAHICGGLSVLYLSALAAAGIPARYVGLFENSDGTGNNHATVEAYVGGRWIASDPTYNTMYRIGEAWAGYAELRDAYETGTVVEVVTSPRGVLPGRHPDDYPIALATLMRFIHLHPATIAEAGIAHVEVPERFIPDGWDSGAMGRGGRRVTQPAVGIYEWLRTRALQ